MSELITLRILNPSCKLNGHGNTIQCTNVPSGDRGMHHKSHEHMHAGDQQKVPLSRILYVLFIGTGKANSGSSSFGEVRARPADLWLRAPARLHQLSTQSVNQAPTLPLRTGLKINLVSLTSGGLSVIHTEELCGLPTHTRTYARTQTDRETLPRRRASLEIGWWASWRTLVEQAEKERIFQSSWSVVISEDLFKQIIFLQSDGCVCIKKL